MHLSIMVDNFNSLDLFAFTRFICEFLQMKTKTIYETEFSFEKDYKIIS
jgi:hypothetical protein